MSQQVMNVRIGGMNRQATIVEAEEVKRNKYTYVQSNMTRQLTIYIDQKTGEYFVYFWPYENKSKYF